MSAPTEAGLYWATLPDHGQLLAVVEGRAPFLRLFLLDPFTRPNGGADLRWEPSEQEMERLTWQGRVPAPPKAEAPRVAKKGGAR